MNSGCYASEPLLGQRGQLSLVMVIAARRCQVPPQQIRLVRPLGPESDRESLEVLTERDQRNRVDFRHQCNGGGLVDAGQHSLRDRPP